MLNNPFVDSINISDMDFKIVNKGERNTANICVSFVIKTSEKLSAPNLTGVRGSSSGLNSGAINKKNGSSRYLDQFALTSVRIDCANRKARPRKRPTVKPMNASISLIWTNNSNLSQRAHSLLFLRI